TQQDHTWISAQLVNSTAVNPSQQRNSSLSLGKVAFETPVDAVRSHGSRLTPEEVEAAVAPDASDAVTVGSAPMPAVSTSRLPPVDIPLIADSTWYQARQLDVFPRALSAVSPTYPELGGQVPLNGEVTLEVLIDESGHVHAADVVRATPEGYFEDAAVAAFR